MKLVLWRLVCFKLTLFWLLSCFGCCRVLVVVVFWLLSCFGCCRVLVVVMFWLLSCFGCCHVFVVVFLLLSCFGCCRVLVVVVFWLLSCFGSCHVLVVVVFWFLSCFGCCRVFSNVENRRLFNFFFNTNNKNGTRSNTMQKLMPFPTHFFYETQSTDIAKSHVIIYKKVR